MPSVTTHKLPSETIQWNGLLTSDETIAWKMQNEPRSIARHIRSSDGSISLFADLNHRKLYLFFALPSKIYVLLVKCFAVDVYVFIGKIKFCTSLLFQVTDLACSNDGRYVFTTGGTDATTLMWEANVM